VPPIIYSAAANRSRCEDFAAMAGQPRHGRYYTLRQSLPEQLAAQLATLEAASAEHTTRWSPPQAWVRSVWCCWASEGQRPCDRADQPLQAVAFLGAAAAWRALLVDQPT
jgi:hypothetical protein